MTISSSFLREASERGYLHQCSDMEGLDALMCKGPITAYAGFDPTAKSLQVGNLMQIMLLRLLYAHKHQPIFLMGGATARIGDPSGKTNLRQMLSPENIQNNIESIQCVLSKFVDFSNQQTILLNNADWLLPLNYIDFLRDYGSLLSVNRMLGFESVKSRLDRQQPLSFLEFNYMIFQAYDYLHLAKNYNCVLQTGGSDQWGNIVSGLDLVRRVTGKEVFALTTELVVNADGQKMGKTANGAVWLNADLTSPYDFWQFWRNTHDQDVIKYLKLFTDLPMLRIQELSTLTGQSINEAKIVLADRMTEIIHGSNALPAIHQTIASFFSKEGEAADAFEIGENDRLKTISDILISFNLMKSHGEVKRLAEGNGLKIDDQPLLDPRIIITSLNKKTFKVSLGKKKHYVFNVL